MKKSNTAQRLKQIMDERNIKQTDILRLTIPYCNKYGVKMNKSDISQYCSGKVEPNQNKLFVLSAALDVNEAWLMGFDVPMSKSALEKYQQSMDEAETFKALLSSWGWSYKTIDFEMGTKFIFSNGSTSFEVSADDYCSLLEDSKVFIMKRLQKLMFKSTSALFKETLLNAAHERTDIDIPTDIDVSDNDIMDDENF